MRQSKDVPRVSYAHSIQSEVAVPVETASDCAIKQEDNSQNNHVLVKG